MLSFFRRTLGSQLALGLLAVVMLAFIITGVTSRSMSDAGGGARGSGDSIAKVGDHKVYASEAEDRARRELAADSQQQPGLTMPVFVAGGGFDQAVRQLLAAAAMEVFGRDHGLVASKKLVDGAIAGIQAFKGPTGKFDESTFRAVLAQQHISEQQLRSELAGDAIRQQLLLPIAGAARVPLGVATPFASLLLESRAGAVAVVPTQAMAGGKDPTDAELAAWYKSHLPAYTLPERRVLKYALIGRDQVAGGAIPTEADIANFYKANAASYAAKETRTLRQVILDSQAKAQAFADKVKSGTSFAGAAKAAGFGANDIAVGEKTQAQFAGLASPAVAAAAFAAKEDSTTAPAKSDFGWNVVHVDKITRTPAKTLEDARPEIAASLAKQKQDEALADLVNGIEDQLGDGTSFDDIVKKRGLAVTTTPAVLPNGSAPDQPDYKAPAEFAVLAKPAFQTSPDEKPTVQTIGNGERYALLAVTQVLPPTPQPLDKAHDKVARDFSADRAAKRAQAIAEAIAAKVNAGSTLSEAVKGAGVALPDPKKIEVKRIQLAQSQGQIPAGLAALFDMTKPGARAIAAPNGVGWFIVKLDTITPGDAKTAPGLVQSARGQFAQLIGEEYAEQFANAAQAEVGVKRDENAIGKLRAKLLGIAPAQ
ncbi:MAG: SurA N-terminal domain-containing protein [Sphingomonadaceae bacterium]|nr:SurA N-terminal domain-containing protein [Sphingomonadaceae bacterium]